MKLFNKTPSIAALAAAIAAIAGSAHAEGTLLSGWDFNLGDTQWQTAGWIGSQTLTATHTDATAGVMKWDGTDGSTSFSSSALGDQATTAAGTTSVNQEIAPRTTPGAPNFGSHFSSTETDPEAFGLSASNGSVVFSVSTTGATDISIAYASAQIGDETSSAADSIQWAWAVPEGETTPTFTDAGSAQSIPVGSYALSVIDLSEVDDIEGQETVLFRATFSGASGEAGGLNTVAAIDNVQILSGVTHDGSFWSSAALVNTSWRNTAGVGGHGIGWAIDTYWPWLYCLGFTGSSYVEGAEWVWVFNQNGASLSGWYGYRFEKGSWFWTENTNGWYYDYQDQAWDYWYW